MSITDSVWTEGAQDFMSLRHYSQERSLHPKLLSLIGLVEGTHLLDYGCGDGRILSGISNQWKVDAYDPSAEMRALVNTNYRNKVSQLYSSPQEINGTYDVILLGMVLVCISEKLEFQQVLENCARMMHADSRLFITTTHPCFRNWDFSNISTSFGKDQPYQYLKEGSPFEVTIHDSKANKVTFTDFHWSIGFTIGILREVGLNIESFIEVPDDPESQRRNEYVPPFLIITCRREI